MIIYLKSDDTTEKKTTLMEKLSLCVIKVITNTASNMGQLLNTALCFSVFIQVAESRTEQNADLDQRHREEE